MVFGRVGEIISAAASHISASLSAISHTSSSSNAGSDHGFEFSSSRQKNSLRLSSSLQDISAYRRVDLEDGDRHLGIDKAQRSQPHLLLQDNAVSSFSKEKGMPAKLSLRRTCMRFLVCFIFLLLLASLIHLFTRYYYSKDSKFFVVLDCGSTGTRVYVYQASIAPDKEGLPITLRSFPEGFTRKRGSQSGRAYDRMETEPGFDKLVYNISGLRAAIKPLLKWAKKQIPKHAHKSTFLFLYATAGVRRLPSADSEWLLDNVWSILRNSPFLCQRKWVKIITGTEEAYYGWIALNYHVGVLAAKPKRDTYGALDLGGSSLQVTFENKEQLHNQTNLNLRIGAVNHRLSAYSLSGYGLNDAFDKSVIHLIKKRPEIMNADLVSGKVELKHPCLQTGYKENYNCLHCDSSYLDSGSPLVGDNILSQGGKPGINVQLSGAPNWEDCNALAKISVNLSEWSDESPGFDCDLQPCALPDGMPRPSGQFYAMSGFFVVHRFFNLTSESALDDVLEKGREFCEKTWDVAKSSVPPQPFTEQYCFRAPYIVLLLREGLHITDDHVTIGSGSITWTLGVALFEAGKAFSTTMMLHHYEIFRLKINPIVLFTILFISLFLLVCALSCAGDWGPRFLRRSYLPLFGHNSVSTASVLNISTPFRFQRWSPISPGDGRVKLPLSPTVSGGQQRPFAMGDGFGGSSSIQLMQSSLGPPTSSVSHSYSSGSLGQVQFDGGSISSFWSPHRSQMRLQSRRSQSREDLNSSLAEPHMMKV